MFFNVENLLVFRDYCRNEALKCISDNECKKLLEKCSEDNDFVKCLAPVNSLYVSQILKCIEVKKKENRHNK
jgi:hypothetical protein